MPVTISEADEDLYRLEHDIRQYKIEYEQYFGGGRKRPPNETEWRIETTLKRYGDRDAELTYRQRFRYNNLVQTYAKYREISRKRMKRHEEGTVQRHYGAAARSIETERARQRKMQSSAGVAVTCIDPAREPRKLEQIYTAFREAVERTGESTAQLTREEFKDFLRKKAEELRKQNGNQAVEFVVSVENGKARLKARVCEDERPERGERSDKKPV